MSDKGKNSSLFPIVNISVRNPVSEKTIASVIRTGLFRPKYYTAIFAFFTELPLVAILGFIKKHKLSALQILKFYNKNVKKYFRNSSLEEYFKYAK